MMISVLRQAMSSAGYSQRALADLTGISQSTLNRVISGERPSKLPEIMVMADALGCTVAQVTSAELSDRV